MSDEFKQSPKLAAFLEALPHCAEDDFCNPPGLGGGFRVKHIRRGLERGVLAEHSSGMGLTIVQPDTHGACGFCKGRKGSQPCEHCACAMCSWFRQTEERASPKVGREKLRELARRMKNFEFGSARAQAVPDLDDDF